MPEPAVPRGWTNDPVQLQDVPTADDLREDYGFKGDIEDTIAIIMSDDGNVRLLFEVRIGGQAHLYLWNPLASVLRSVAGAKSINGILDKLHKGHGIVGPEIPYKAGG